MNGPVVHCGVCGAELDVIDWHLDEGDWIIAVPACCEDAS